MNLQEKILERIRESFVIDAHEHLMSEREQLALPKDALLVYGQYTRLPMFASGLSQEDWRRMHDPEVPLMQRWAIAKPFINLIKHTSFARAARMTLQSCWGVDELTDDNVGSVSERIVAENKPGLYERVLRGKCKILSVLNQDTGQNDSRDLEAYKGQEILKPVVSLIDVKLPENREINHLVGPDGFKSLDDYLDFARTRLETMAQGGAVGFKTFSYPLQSPDRISALEEFGDLKSEAHSIRIGAPSALYSYILDELLSTVPRLGVPVAVHTGFWGVTVHNPSYMVPIIERHPNVHFDLFHSGIPYVRVLGTIAVNYPNTSVNLCWAHSINAAMTADALNEYIDQLGIDKIIAFGGDVRWMVEKVCGHLELARQNVASVLTKRVHDGLMDIDDAYQLAQKWFFDNPARIYKLPAQLD